MIKDISFNEIKNVAVAVVREGDEDSADWTVYLINLNSFPLTGVFITSKGYGALNQEDLKTSELRWFFEEVAPGSVVKVEVIVEEVFGLHNEYWVSYYVGKEIYDKRFVFLAESIKPENFTQVPVINEKGVMIK
jgi:hypothetical protein